MTNKVDFDVPRNKENNQSTSALERTLKRLDLLNVSKKIVFERFEINLKPRKPRKSNPKHWRFKPYCNSSIIRSNYIFRRSRAKSESLENILHSIQPSTTTTTTIPTNTIIVQSNLRIKRAKSLDSLHDNTNNVPNNENGEVELVSTKIKQLNVSE